jgi:hypothetical protein
MNGGTFRDPAATTQATLETARIRLVPLSDDHLEHETELDADPEVMRYMGRPRSLQDVGGLHRRRLAARATTRLCVGDLNGDP